MPLTGKQETGMSTEVMQCSWQKKEVRTKGKSGGDSQHDRKCRVGHRSKETCKSFLQVTFICNVQETTSSAKMKRNEVLEVWGEKYKAVSHSGEWEHVGSMKGPPEVNVMNLIGHHGCVFLKTHSTARYRLDWMEKRDTMKEVLQENWGCIKGRNSDSGPWIRSRVNIQMRTWGQGSLQQ